MHEQTEYIRRVNLDGSYTSICPLCFLTVAVRTAAANLKAQEARHVCHRSIWESNEPLPQSELWP